MSMTGNSQQSFVGFKRSLIKVITAEDVERFAQLSMDNNPIHLDESFAQGTMFKKRIAHGAYVASFISAVIANELPGKGSIYLKQESNFKKPVFLNDEIKTTVEIVDSPKPGIFILSTNCYNQNGDIVIEGQAVVMNKEFRGI